MAEVIRDDDATGVRTDDRPPWVALFGDDAPDALAAPWEVSRRRRFLLALSMLLVVPLGLFAIGVGLNVVVLQGAANSYAQKDYLGSASWARWGVSLNPIDPFTARFDLGTAYSKAGLLDDGRAELTTAFRNASGSEQKCPARMNLALTYEKLGDRARSKDDLDAAARDYGQAQALWQGSGTDSCGSSQDFTDSSDSAQPRLQRKQEQTQQDQQQQQQQQQQNGQQGQNGQDQQGQDGQGDQPGQGDQSGQGQGDQPGQGDQSGRGQGDQSGDGQGDQSGDGQGDQPGDGQDAQSQDGQSGQGDQSGQGGQSGQNGQGSQNGQGAPGTQQGTQPGIGEGSKDSSKTLGEKLGALKSRDEQATRSRDQGDPGYSSGSSKPW